MTNLNVYLNSCLSTVICTLRCGLLGYLVLTSHPDVFSTHYGTAFLPPTNPGIRPVMLDPAPMATILSELVRTHKHEVRLFNIYHAIDWAFKKVIIQFIPYKYYNDISSWIIGFTKVTSLQILTHLITNYAELEDDDIQEIDRKMKEPISGETVFEEFIEKIELNQKSCHSAKYVYFRSDCLYGVSKHQKMRAISRWFSGIVPKTKAQEDLENFQRSLRKSVQENPKIIKDFKYRGVCSQCAIHTSQYGIVHQDAAGPHHGAVKSYNGDTSRQNIGLSVDENNRGDLNPSLYPHRHASNGTIRERPYKNIWTMFGPSRSGTLFSQWTGPIPPKCALGLKFLFKEREKIDSSRYWSPHVFKVKESHTSATWRYLDDGKKISTRLDT